MTFGERLTDLRVSAGYTKRNEFADKLGIPSTTLRNYETDAREPGHTFLKQVSEFFNVSVDYLLGLTDDKEILSPFRLKTAEYAYIEKYRTLDFHGKDMVDTVLSKEYDRCESIKKAKPIQLADRSYLEPVAAHDRTDIDVAPDMVEKDNDIMDNDGEWK